MVYYDEKFAVIVDACSSNKKKACIKKKTEKKIKFPPTNVFYVSINRWCTVNSNISIQISSSAFSCEFICFYLGNNSRLAVYIAAFV